jgi:hypothetical protein
VFLFAGAAAPTGAACTFGIDLGIATDPAAVAEGIHDSWRTTILTVQNDDCVLDTVRVKFGPNDTGGFGEYTDPTGGGQVGDGVPAQVAVLCKKNTNLGGRQGRGRMYIPGLDETTVGENGSIAPGTVVLWQTEVDAFEAALGPATDGMVLLHGNSLSPTEVTSLVIDGRVATQRRRLRR